jgi:hypothetical protein
MTDRYVPSNPLDPTDPNVYSTIRQAISASLTGDSIIIAAGSWSITDGGPPTLAYAAGPNIYSISGFTSATQWLAFSGAGNDGDASTTTITGNSRLFVVQSDGKPPTKIDIRNLDFLYSGASGYILQTGSFGQLTGATPSEIFLDNLSFRGTHAGAGSATNNPFGNFGAVLGFQKFTLNNSSVTLNKGFPTTQASFTGTQSVSGGSSFLMLQGGIGAGNNLTISNNIFDESGFRNAVSIFESKNVTLSGNTFRRTEANTRYSRSRLTGTAPNQQREYNVSNKIADSQAVLTGNNFFDGSYLVYEKGLTDLTTSNTLSLGQAGGARNTFAQFDGTLSPVPNPILEGGAVGVVLQGATLTPASIPTLINNTFSYVTPFSNLTSTVFSFTTGSGNQFVDPVNNVSKSINRYFVGGTCADSLAGSTASDVLIGGLGNDTITSGASTATNQDYIIFNTPIEGGTNIDSVYNFNRATGTAPTAAFDRIILDRRIFTGITAKFAGTTTSSIGAVDASNIENNTTGLPTQLATRLIYRTDTGALFYDEDGNTPGGKAPIQFANLYSTATPPTPPTPASPISLLVGLNAAGTNLANVNIGII